MASRQAYAAAAAVLTIVACKQREHSSAEAVPARPIDARTLAELPASTHAAMTSAPRDEWPCEFEVREHQGDFHAYGHSVFTYGSRTTCRVPTELLAQGIWGCPDKFVRTDGDGMVRDRTFTYDEQNRLIEYKGHTNYKFTWDGDRLASTTNDNFDGSHTMTYVDDGDRVLALEDGKLVEALTLQQGRLVQVDDYLDGAHAATGHLRWQGKRPVSIDVESEIPMPGSVERIFSYACR